MKKIFYFLVCSDYDKTTSVYKREWPPLCVLNCISILRKHAYEGKIISTEEAYKLSEGDTLIVSTGTIDRSLAPSIRLNSLYKFCEEISSKVEVFITGVHATLFPQFLIDKTGVVAVLPGMPELAVLHYCETGQWGGYDWHHGSNNIRIDEWGAPAYDLVKDQEYVFEPMGWKNFGIFELGRGCEQNCHFCAKDAYYGKGSSFKTAEAMVGDLTQAIKEYGFKSGYFMDVCFLSYRQRAEEFCQLLAREKSSFVWACETRAEDLDEDIVDIMYAAGCRMIGIGVCSFHDFVEKGAFNLEFYQEKISMLERKGIRTLAYYIVSPFFRNKTSYDDEVFNNVHKILSTFASIRRYLDFKNTDWLLKEIKKEKPYRLDQLDLIIKKNMFQFYFKPCRCFRILKQVGMFNIFNCMRFFIRFIFTNKIPLLFLLVFI